ncbi:MAG: flagellar biosynthesis protein FlgM [Sulfurimonas sp.]|nr:MAG: flagellar biosynthesis protein FlgM [Sulfurimonas sp.]
MISQINNAAVTSTYAKNVNANKETAKTSNATISSQGDKSKVDQIKEALDSGEYKINLQALSQKIADELL